MWLPVPYRPASSAGRAGGHQPALVDDEHPEQIWDTSERMWLDRSTVFSPLR